jgi:predicted DNA-binding transcriptional regulator AlpA
VKQKKEKKSLEGQQFGTESSADSAVFDEHEMAAYIKVSVPTLNRWRKRGEGPAWARFGKKLIRYTKAAADAYIESPDRYHPNCNGRTKG